MDGAVRSLSLKGRALRLLGTREHSRAELERKLQPFEQSPGELARALDELQHKGFIDERRVLESVLHRRAAGFGAARIRQELQRKGLAQDVIHEAVRDLQGSDLERALALWRKRFGLQGAPSGPDGAREMARQARYLASRGFSGEVIQRVLRRAAGGGGAELPDAREP